MANGSGIGGNRILGRARAAAYGAVAWIVGVVQFVIAMGVTQAGYGPPAYSLTGNYISDLGAAHCGYWHGGGSFPGFYVCSPWHVVFNVSIIGMGILLAAGTVLVYSAFRPGVARVVWFVLFLVAAAGSIGVGLFPEDVNITAHGLSAVAAFAGSGLALVLLGAGIYRDRRWDGLAIYTIASGLLGLIALVLFLEQIYGPLGVGGMERLIVAPVLLWAIVASVRILRMPARLRGGLGA
ncbi:MAG: DUF998 domain-containing protein [Thermoplasmata archaeon]